MDEFLRLASNNIAAIAMAGVLLAYFWRREGKHDADMDRRIKEHHTFVETVLENIKSIKDDFSVHNKDITNDFRMTIHQLHDDFKDLFQSHLDVTKSNVLAVEGLKVSLAENSKAIVELRSAMESLRSEVHRNQIIYSASNQSGQSK